jgi:hypothetical protein
MYSLEAFGEEDVHGQSNGSDNCSVYRDDYGDGVWTCHGAVTSATKNIERFCGH